MYFVSGAFYEFARNGILSLISYSIFGAGRSSVRLVTQPQSLLQLHLAEIEQNNNNQNLVNNASYRGRRAQG